MALHGSIRGAAEKVAPKPCPHCSGSRYILDLEETTFGEWDEHFHLCFMCCGTGQKMDKAERKAHRELTGVSE